LEEGEAGRAGGSEWVGSLVSGFNFSTSVDGGRGRRRRRAEGCEDKRAGRQEVAEGGEDER